jgi:hypothetical protein
MRGGDFDRWDLAVRGGMMGSARCMLAIEEHGAGRQYLRLRIWPHCARLAVVAIAALALLAAGAAADGSHVATSVLACLGGLLVVRAVYECAAAKGALVEAVAGSVDKWGGAPEISAPAGR